MIINEKKAQQNKDGVKGCYVIGIILIVLGGYWLLFSSKGLGMGAIVVGLFFIYCGKYNQGLIASFYKYVEIMGDKEVISISELASRAGESEEVVVRNLSQMIINNYFENMQIDSGNEFFRTRDYFEKYSEKETQEDVNEMNQIMDEMEESLQGVQTEPEKIEEYYSEICECCGGTTKIKVGGGGVCDYCRAPIGTYKEYDD